MSNSKDSKPNINAVAQLKSDILHIISTSSIHGVPNILRSKSLVLRLLWILFFVLAFGLCAVLIGKNIFK